MVEGFKIGAVGVGVCKASESRCIGNEDSLEKCKGDRGVEETHWYAICFNNDELMEINSYLCKLDREDKWLRLKPKYLMHQTQYIK